MKRKSDDQDNGDGNHKKSPRPRLSKKRQLQFQQQQHRNHVIFQQQQQQQQQQFINQLSMMDPATVAYFLSSTQQQNLFQRQQQQLQQQALNNSQLSFNSSSKNSDNMSINPAHVQMPMQQPRQKLPKQMKQSKLTVSAATPSTPKSLFGADTTTTTIDVLELKEALMGASPDLFPRSTIAAVGTFQTKLSDANVINAAPAADFGGCDDSEELKRHLEMIQDIELAIQISQQKL